MTKFVYMLAGCLVLLIAVPISIQAQNATVPDVCIIETPTNESLRACADATPEGSQPNAWAHTYLGANAYIEGVAHAIICPSNRCRGTGSQIKIWIAPTFRVTESRRSLPSKCLRHKYGKVV